jgi:hypothetical protein
LGSSIFAQNGSIASWSIFISGSWLLFVFSVLVLIGSNIASLFSSVAVQPKTPPPCTCGLVCCGLICWSVIILMINN